MRDRQHSLCAPAFRASAAGGLWLLSCRSEGVQSAVVASTH
ncbi:hypothetical protein [Micrococcus terreus]|nr:hypothetical protein [Micrococcus terreus]MDK7699998.1 hypothetical protein [Micrococcus terreus]WOO98383.1 hypothetical protein R3I42_04380 [Micrococcus terreus]